MSTTDTNKAALEAALQVALRSEGDALAQLASLDAQRHSGLLAGATAPPSGWADAVAAAQAQLDTARGEAERIRPALAQLADDVRAEQATVALQVAQNLADAAQSGATSALAQARDLLGQAAAALRGALQQESALGLHLQAVNELQTTLGLAEPTRYLPAARPVTSALDADPMLRAVAAHQRQS